MTDLLHIEFSELESTAQRMQQAQSEISRILSDLESRAGQLRAGWTGQASEAYVRTQREWRDSMSGMTKALSVATKLLQEATQAMRQVEQAVAKQWP